ncbi:thiosulfate sulfurtransferase/rhodanese-like domain-containing protein 3 [Dunckerocampus dactyliophorus]|uniref:thiosulfate sulfurtransferase/rhodanese-like domain-containing protein 3 n=1 Tax=Dunckerocampus dactyliophorus TaxID=161453 RepID=UPI002405D7F1|nr:thiosulfate sulfurtransferase/rhodanese-like domain-containing protein 3 [Dunckerocampus dactyliophorus]
MSLRRCLGFFGAESRRLCHSYVLHSASAQSRRVFSSLTLNTHPFCTKLWLGSRSFASVTASTDVTYEQLRQLLAGGKAVVIDVREPWELREYGFIPGSINVPLGQVNAALQLDPGEFTEKYGAEMPGQADNIVFTCLAGIRSKTALDAATSLGYKDVQHYPGGWKDWAKNEHQN